MCSSSGEIDSIADKIPAKKRKEKNYKIESASWNGDCGENAGLYFKAFMN